MNRLKELKKCARCPRAIADKRDMRFAGGHRVCRWCLAEIKARA